MGRSSATPPATSRDCRLRSLTSNEGSSHSRDLDLALSSSALALTTLLLFGLTSIAKTQYKFLIDNPPDRKKVSEAEYEDLSVEDAQTRILLWNNMEPKISGRLVLLNTAKRVWNGTNEMYSGMDNLHRTYELHQTFFSLTLDYMSLKDYYARFRGMYEELDLAKTISTNISVMQMRVHARCSSLMWSASSFDSVRAQLLGTKELPSLSEVFSCL
ncbi:hypothetical protein Acr_21g0002950 [Actinidia rufa]|uniref:Uncharacterized protein n=1 Tax=Actinidia rufa TaxID=165716 RepID=A0A7J0GFW4_9ERIC|nr:hypothetical protein Acr_21g0002950 [Actinidia rufa]